MDQHVWKHEQLLNSLVPEGNRQNLLVQWMLSGNSKSALRTGFKMGPFNLDAGHTIFDTWNVLLISHGHADHIFSVASFFLVHVTDDNHIFAPNPEHVKSYARGLLVCNHNSDSIKLSGNWHMAVPNDIHRISIPSRKGVNKHDIYTIRIIKLKHSIPSVGYCVSKHTSRLNPRLVDFKEKVGNEIFVPTMKALKQRQKVPTYPEFDDIAETGEIQTTLILPQFCFITDTAIAGISNNIDIIKEYPIIIVECTFFHKDNVDHAVEKQHIHWNQLEAFIRLYSNSLWVLIHSSKRYTDHQTIINSIKTNHEPVIDSWELPTNCLLWIK